eukprot:GEMP01021510.1.p1 GENE.GEMP01021510.1~~GEMP01021510.1.p1  ORF type:complete len:519 (+),score=165.14 GEMP01021510.1:150-1706(+)
MNAREIFDNFADDDDTLSQDAWVFACGELAEAGEIAELDEETLQTAFNVLFQLDEPANIPFEEFEEKLPYFLQNAQDAESLEAFLAEVVENGFAGATAEEEPDDEEYEAAEDEQDDGVGLVEEYEAEEGDLGVELPKPLSGTDITTLDGMSPIDPRSTVRSQMFPGLRPAVSFAKRTSAQSPVLTVETSSQDTAAEKRSTTMDARRSMMSYMELLYRAASADFLPVPRPPLDESLKIRLSPSLQVVVKKQTSVSKDVDNDKAQTKQGKKKEQSTYIGPPRFAAETLRGLSSECRDKVMQKELEALHEEIAHELRARNSAIHTLEKHYPATFARSAAPMRHTAFEVRVASMKHGPIRTPEEWSVSPEPKGRQEEFAASMSPADAVTFMDVQLRVRALLSKLHVQGTSQVSGVDAVRAGIVQAEKELNLLDNAAVVRQQLEPRRPEQKPPSASGHLPWRSTKNESRGFSHTPWPVFGTARNFYADPPSPRAIHKAREAVGIYDYHYDRSSQKSSDNSESD